MKMSRNYFPTPEDSKQALARLDQARRAFEHCLEQQDRSLPGAGLTTLTLAEASRAYRRALLDPHLPPPG